MSENFRRIEKVSIQKKSGDKWRMKNEDNCKKKMYERQKWFKH